MTRSTGTVSSPKKSVLICFSPEDKEGKAELEAHLAAVCSTLTWWSVEEIEAGESLRENFQRIAGKADVALLLLSADFCSALTKEPLAYPAELSLFEQVDLLRQQKQRGMQLIPLLWRDCAWRAIGWLAEQQPLPVAGTAIRSLSKAGRDRELAQIARWLGGSRGSRKSDKVAVPTPPGLVIWFMAVGLVIGGTVGAGTLAPQTSLRHKVSVPEVAWSEEPDYVTESCTVESLTLNWHIVPATRDGGAEGQSKSGKEAQTCPGILQDDLLSWAAMQNYHGNVLREEAQHAVGAERQRLLNEAVEAYRQALQVRTREYLPQERAETQINLGNALQEQGKNAQGEESQRLLKAAVQAYQEALQVYKLKQQPQQWAIAKNDLGNALQAQGERAKGAESQRLLSEAIQAYREALEVRSNDNAALSVIINLYQTQLFEFDKAYALLASWLQRHPQDLDNQANFAEAQMMTGRFADSAQSLARLLVNPALGSSSGDARSGGADRAWYYQGPAGATADAA